MISSNLFKKTIASLSLSNLSAAAFLGLLLVGCGSVIRSIDPEAVQNEKEDSLITFKESVASGNYVRAVHRLVANEQREFLDAKGRVREDMRPRLRALRLKDLVRNPHVKLDHGKLAGIYAALPVVELGKELPESSFEITDETPKLPNTDSLKESRLHAAAALFFSDIRAGNWQYVLNDMYPSTRSEFVSRNGKIKASARVRLAAIDTTAWQDLGLRHGKLIGVVLIIPPPQPELEKAATAFFEAVSGQDWSTALGMLDEKEKDYLSGPDGNIKPAYKDKLSKLDPDDWDALFWYDQKLSGVLDLLDENPQAPSH